MSDKRAVIYCSSSRDIDPAYNEAARQIVRAACLAGYDIVSGGSWRGTPVLAQASWEESAP